MMFRFLTVARVDVANDTVKDGLCCLDNQKLNHSIWSYGMELGTFAIVGTQTADGCALVRGFAIGWGYLKVKLPE